MHKILSIIICLLFTGVLTAQESVMVDKIIGVVGDNIIMMSDIESQLQQARSQGEKINDDVKCAIFDQALLEKFFLAQAQLDSVYVAEDEVESELDKRIRYYISNSFGSQEKLEEFYGKSIEDLKADFRRDVKNQMLAEKMQGKIYGNIKTTPSDVKQFFEAIPKDSLPYFNAEIELSQIVIFPKASQEAKDYALMKISKIKEEIMKGTDFGVKAQLVSEDPGSKKEGGDLGFITRGQMVSEFEAAAFRLEEGQVSDVVETKYGYHLIQCLEKKGERIHVRHILITAPITSFDETTAKIYLDSIRTLITTDQVTFTNAVKEYSEDEQSKSNSGSLINAQTGNSYFEMNQIDGSLLFTISDLKNGQLSQTSTFTTEDGKKGFRMIMIKSETVAHQANLKEDYTKIAAATKQAKQQEALVKWIKDRKGDTYIMVDDNYRSCDNVQKWIVQ